MEIETAIPLNKTGLREHYLSLTESQMKFVTLIIRWCRRPCKKLVVLSGGPGTGKSYVVNKTLDFVKTEPLKMSYTARSALAIGGRTIHSTVNLNYTGPCHNLEKSLENEADLVTAIKKSKSILKEFKYEGDPSIVVIDEVSMINGWLIYWLIHFFMERTTKPLLFITIGDPHQLNPVKSVYNLFSFNYSKKRWQVENIYLKENKRFSPEYGKLIERLRQFVDEENESGLFAFICQHFPVYDDITGTQLAEANRAMASKNYRVDTFNAYYIKNMMHGPEIEIQDRLVLKPGCIVIVIKNNCSSVTNGTELKFIRFCKYTDRIICTDPKTKDEVIVRRDPKTNTFPLVLGFAATVHKFQGETIDDAKIVIHFDGNRNLNLAYTALSRVRHMDQILAISL